MTNGRPLTLHEIRMRAATNAANGRSILPMDRLRKERAQVIGDARQEPARLEMPHRGLLTAAGVPVAEMAPEAPPDPDDAPSEVAIVDQIAHSVIQLGLWEKKINQPIIIGFPDGKRLRLGDLLLALGNRIIELEKTLAERDAEARAAAP